MIDVNYKYTDSIEEIQNILNKLPSVISCDFETASKYTLVEKNKYSKLLEQPNLDYTKKIKYNQIINSDGLYPPELTIITHLNIGIAKNKAYVFILPTDEHRDLVCKFLITNTNLQIWHGCVFDFKHLYHHTKQLPKYYVDTQLLLKTITNHANSSKGLVGLKEVMGYQYGLWGESSDLNFTIELMYNSNMLKYCATDAAATYKLYQDICKGVYGNTSNSALLASITLDSSKDK